MDLLNAVRDHDFVACRSGHKVSKTCSAAILGMWWAAMHKEGRAILTSTSKEQLKSALWPEFRRLWRLGAERGYKIGEEPALDPATGWRLGELRGVFSRTTDKAERVAGISGAEQLYIVDEASGYPDDLLEAMTGNLAGGGKMLLIGNPTQTSGTFYDAFHDKQHLWFTLHIRSTDTPNFHGGNVPGLAGPTWLARMKEYWGEGTPLWDVRILGNFPRSAPDAVIPLMLSELARARYEAGAFDEDKHRTELGVDVARGGNDSTVMLPRRGYTLGAIDELRGSDSDTGPKVGNRVMALVRGDADKPALRRGERERVKVKIDTIGVGASAYDSLRERHDAGEIELVGVNSSERADDEEQYFNLRSQLHFAVRDWLRDGGQLPDDKMLAGELVAAKFSFDNRGRYKVEPKDDIKSRIKRSPDRADALALAVYSPQTGYQGDLPAVITYDSPMAGW